jgi:hypothetical protein
MSFVRSGIPCTPGGAELKLAELVALWFELWERMDGGVVAPDVRVPKDEYEDLEELLREELDLEEEAKGGGLRYPDIS